MEHQSNNRKEHVIATLLDFVRSGYEVWLGETDGEEVTDYDVVAPRTPEAEIRRMIAVRSDQAIMPLLPAEPNGLIFAMTDKLTALEEASHGDLPITYATREDGSVVAVYQAPHSPRGRLQDQEIETSHGTVFLQHEAAVRLLPPGGGGHTCACAGAGADRANDIAEAPAWVALAMCRGPLQLGEAHIAVQEDPTEEDLLRMGIFLNKHGEPKGVNANHLVDEVTRRIRLLRTPCDDYLAYDGGAWAQQAETAVPSFFRDLVNAYAPGLWRPTIGMQIMRTLQMAVPVLDPSDEPRWGACLANGIIDLDSLEILPHSKRHRFTVRLPIAYDPAADCPRTRQFLEEVMDGDPQRVAILIEWAGLCLTAETRAEKALIMYGTGANGKSTYIDLLSHLCGTANVSHVSLARLQSKFSVYSLVGKLLNVSAEAEIRGALNTEMFKNLVSGECIPVEKKFRQGYSYRPYAKLAIATNNLPRTDDKSEGFTRRLLMLPFGRVFADSEKDRFLKEKLMQELPGFLNLAIEGLKRLRANEYQFTASTVSQGALREYRMMLNPYLSFVDDRVRAMQGGRVERPRLRDAFGRWCRANGYAPLANEEPRRFFAGFREALIELGLPTCEETSNGKRYFTGITVINRPEGNSGIIQLV